MLEQLSEQEVLRRQSLKALRELGINPYPAARFEVNATAKQIADEYDAEKGNFSEVSIAGRIQVYIRRDDICPEGDPTLYNTVFKKLLDIGDFIGVEGFAFRTNTGELSVHCQQFTLLSKSLRQFNKYKIIGKAQPAVCLFKFRQHTFIV